MAGFGGEGGEEADECEEESSSGRHEGIEKEIRREGQGKRDAIGD